MSDRHLLATGVDEADIGKVITFNTPTQTVSGRLGGIVTLTGQVPLVLSFIIDGQIFAVSSPSTQQVTIVEIM